MLKIVIDIFFAPDNKNFSCFYFFIYYKKYRAQFFLNSNLEKNHFDSIIHNIVRKCMTTYLFLFDTRVLSHIYDNESNRQTIL